MPEFCHHLLILMSFLPSKHIKSTAEERFAHFSAAFASFSELESSQYCDELLYAPLLQKTSAKCINVNENESPHHCLHLLY